ncbi:hypothetical protein PR1_69 [Providencia phage vB_PreS_PR1]|uniref:Uncharacterized protein n=1 Tax=Providencia phage vB_PreS_PR1 TaxID=1931407 RepID=A0A1S6KV47_9CAUD|nr:hypothetical protein FDH30_gp146 [Providencia phage vB_PreS_PR1]AQT25289.1 hypothetical protein PR1_69 [Providencia phage vB_PreS_PR1]
MKITAILQSKPDQKYQCVCEDCGGTTFYDGGDGCDGCCEIWVNGKCTNCGKQYELHFPRSHFNFSYSDAQLNAILEKAVDKAVQGASSQLGAYDLYQTPDFKNELASAVEEMIMRHNEQFSLLLLEGKF